MYDPVDVNVYLDFGFRNILDSKSVTCVENLPLRALGLGIFSPASVWNHGLDYYLHCILKIDRVSVAFRLLSFREKKDQ